ncbi:hypothetical protein E2C01_055897 [Portunus trituberculatus]|uniref:Uncharacterized protein n=1 Tax=Portunus trituberculatus TaxID=210409 RepID=A0A5B7GNP8_PORTR|nr:hypothetical protein [Portunus trituberculatus]
MANGRRNLENGIINATANRSHVPYAKIPQPYSDDCLVPLTVRHLLVECRSLIDLRHRYLSRCRGRAVPSGPSVVKSAVQPHPRPPVTGRNGDNSHHSQAGRKTAVHRPSSSQLPVSSRQLIISGQGDFDGLVHDLTRPFLLLGCFNGRRPLWDEGANNPRRA